MASPARADHNIRRQINLGDSRVQNGHTYIFTGESNQRHESEEQKREDRYRKFIRLLQFPQINARKQNLRPPISDTCAWFVRTPEYTEWVNPLKFDDHHGFLRIRGKPGAGKSTLMKFLLGKSREALPHAEVVSFFFHARGSELERTAMGLYRALLCQLFELFPDLRITLDELDYKEPSFAEYNGWQIQDLQNLIQHAVGKLRSRNIACYIDALDECPEDEIRDLMSFFQSLGREAAKNKTKLNVCFSSRHYPNISFNEGISLVLEDNPKHVLDIKQYVDLKLRIGDSMEYNEIKDKIMHKSSGVFLWVALVIPMLNKAFDRGKVTALRQQLDKLPSELMALFHDILIRDFEQNLEDRDATLLCIQWVLVARDPLDITELYYGIQLGLGNNFLWEHWLSTTMVQMRRFILNSSKGLVQETMHHEGCKPSGTLEFIHESVRDFLLLDKGLLQLWPHLGENVEGKTHDKIKQICLKRIESARPC
ncbi:hypothetical protein F5B20DRAFT_594055 [Whalleya microplaca]|nr:hypothetical protein F5B20DRAFT_594055 [Whalleya microplaca]